MDEKISTLKISITEDGSRQDLRLNGTRKHAILMIGAMEQMKFALLKSLLEEKEPDAKKD